MRKVANWIDGFMELSADMPSPAILRQWSAISIIAGALERRVWLHTSHPKPLYPNLYVFLVAPPGVGKTSVTGIVNDFWRVTKNSDTEHIHIAPSATSSAAFIDALNDSERRLVRLGEPEPLVKFSALSIASDELGAFLPEYNPAFIQLLTLLYDCNFFDEKKRTKSLNIKVEKPVVNFIAATTPSFLNGMLRIQCLEFRVLK